MTPLYLSTRLQTPKIGAERAPATDSAASIPWEIVALFRNQVPADLNVHGLPETCFETGLLAEIPAFAGPQSQLALLLTAGERQAVAAAQAALYWRCAGGGLPFSARRSACVDHVLNCFRLGAVGIMLPAARRIIGPSVWSEIAPILSESSDQQALFLQFHVVQDEQSVWAHTHGMFYYGLPDLECHTLLADRAAALRALEGGVAYLLACGAEDLVPGSLIESTGPDGQINARFLARPARTMPNHGYDAWGAIEIINDGLEKVEKGDGGHPLVLDAAHWRAGLTADAVN